MSASNPARKRLPVKPSEENLRKQAKRLSKSLDLSLARAQHQLANEYGSRSWAELLHVVETMNRGADQLSNVKRPIEPLPAAVRARDVGKVRQILASGEFTQHDLDAGLAHAAWYGGEAPDVLAVRKELFDLLLGQGADPDGQYGSAYGPIVFGTGECNSVEGLQWLIDAGADVTFPPVDTKYGPQCPLSTWLGNYGRGHNAVKHRGIDLLLRHGAFIPPEVSPPILAIHRGDAKLLGELIDADRSLIRRTFRDMPYGNISLAGATLLHCAVEFDEVECIDAILSRYKGWGDLDMNSKAEVIDGIGGQTPIFHLINTGWASHLDTLKYVIQRAGQWIDLSVRATWRTFDGPRTSAVTAMEYAMEPGDEKWRKNKEEELALLRPLDRRATIRQACERGDIATVTRMLDEHPELLTGDLWPGAIHKAKSLELVRLLLDLGLDPNDCPAPRKPLHLATYYHLADIVELLIERGADVNHLNRLDETPLDLIGEYEPHMNKSDEARRCREALLKAGAKHNFHTAIRAGELELVRRMLDAEPEMANTTKSWSGLYTAARTGQVEIAKLLLERGAKVDGESTRGSTGNTPLWFACQSSADAADRIAVAKLLLEAGANPRRECEDKSTPLHFAAWRGPIAMVELLLRHNAKEWQTDNDGKKPLDYARSGVAADKEQIAELLDRPVIRDPHFRAAVKAIHTGDVAALKRLLAEHPNLVHDRAIEPECYTPGYFKDPKLLWFIADNPNLIRPMPQNTPELAEAIIAAGAEPADIDYTLGLVMTSDPVREANLLQPLVSLLMRHGATVTDDTIYSTLGHGQRDAIAILLAAGVPLTPAIAAGMGDVASLARLLPAASADEKFAALSMAVINNETESARLCLEAGADPNRRSLVHVHATSAHQAALHDNVPLLEVLVAHGAKLDVKDTLWGGTPLGWAVHEKKTNAEAYLRSR